MYGTTGENGGIPNHPFVQEPSANELSNLISLTLRINLVLYFHSNNQLHNLISFEKYILELYISDLWSYLTCLNSLYLYKYIMSIDFFYIYFALMQA